MELSAVPENEPQERQQAGHLQEQRSVDDLRDELSKSLSQHHQ